MFLHEYLLYYIQNLSGGMIMYRKIMGFLQAWKNLDSRQIYFVNQIVEYIIHNGVMKDLSVL